MSVYSTLVSVCLSVCDTECWMDADAPSFEYRNSSPEVLFATA